MGRKSEGWGSLLVGTNCLGIFETGHPQPPWGQPLEVVYFAIQKIVDIVSKNQEPPTIEFFEKFVENIKTLILVPLKLFIF